MVPELYTGTGQPRRKFSLDEIRILLGALGNPQRAFCSVLIAGTNGKGSTAATLASILTASGLADRALYFAASDQSQRAHPHRTRRDCGRRFCEDLFSGSRCGSATGDGWRAAADAELLRDSDRAGILALCRGEDGDCGAGSGHGRAAGRDQRCGSAALGDYRHLARPHGVAWLDASRRSRGKRQGFCARAER